jgi:hypothetical protein
MITQLVSVAYRRGYKRTRHFIIQEVATEHLHFLNESESLHFTDKSTGSDQKKKKKERKKEILAID